MCRLFLQVSKNNESATKYLVSKNNSLLAQSINDVSNRPNADGWGIAWVDTKDKIQMLKSPNPAFLDPKFKLTSGKVKSNIILAHIRRGSIGAVHYDNVHPFMHQKWAFVQNGNIPFLKNDRNALNDMINSEYQKEVIGTTDSELFFYMLLSKLEGVLFSGYSIIIENLSEAVNIVKEKMGTINNKKALNFILINPEIQIGYRLNRNMYYCKENNKIIVASEAINCYNGWKEIAEDTFFIIKDGNIMLFPVHKKNKTVIESSKF